MVAHSSLKKDNSQMLEILETKKILPTNTVQHLNHLWRVPRADFETWHGTVTDRVSKNLEERCQCLFSIGVQT